MCDRHVAPPECQAFFRAIKANWFGNLATALAPVRKLIAEFLHPLDIIVMRSKLEVVIWKASTDAKLEYLGTLSLGDNDVKSVTLSADGKLFVVSAEACWKQHFHISCYSAYPWKLLRHIEAASLWAPALAVSPGAELLAIWSGTHLRLYRVPCFECLAELRLSGGVHQLQFCPTENSIVALHCDYVRGWRVSTIHGGPLRVQASGPLNRFRGLIHKSTMQVVNANGQDQILLLIVVDEGAGNYIHEVSVLSICLVPITRVDLTDIGAWSLAVTQSAVAVGCRDGQLCLLHAGDLSCLAENKLPLEGNVCVAFVQSVDLVIASTMSGENMFLVRGSDLILVQRASSHSLLAVMPWHLLGGWHASITESEEQCTVLPVSASILSD